MPFSPKQQLNGQVVLLTGGCGYLGSVILEQLLRLTEVKQVILLVRPKRGVPVDKRVHELLASPLFHQLHAAALDGKRNVLHRVHAVEGDLTKPSCGLGHADLRTLRSSVGVILHAGANIELDADIQMTLRNNYMGTCELMKVASQFEHLRSFVHVSTYFVNNHLPRNSVVKEQIYPLHLEVGDVPVTHREFVAAMLAMEAEQANKQTMELMDRLDFTSTYAFGKHLTEQLVDSTCIKPGVSRAIVRPSLIASVAQDPYPGFIRSYAGAGGYSMGYALGFFQGVSSVAYASDTFLDLIPADTVAALVIAAGAAACATYGSAHADHSAVVFHAASAQSHPLTIAGAFDRMARFWKANPPPLSLPATSYVRIKGEHTPTQAGIVRGQRLSKLKLRLLGGVLALAGKRRELRALRMGLKAFGVHNSLPYNKSIVCAVDNARALQEQIAPKEAPLWRVVFDESVDSWDRYGFTFLAGVRCLLFRMRDAKVRALEHKFKHAPGLGANELARLLAAAGAPKAPATSSGGGSSSAGSAASLLRCGSRSSSARDAAAAAAVAAAVQEGAAAEAGGGREKQAPQEEQPEGLLKAVVVA